MASFSIEITMLGFQLLGLNIETKKSKKENKQMQEVITHNLQSKEPVLTPPNVKSALAEKKPRADLKELERQLNPAKVKPTPVITECVTCGGKTFDDDIHACSECGISTCSLCGSYDSSSKKHYCDSCWLKV